jgi:pyridoxamine 5'-phosphate oxidase
MRSDPIVLFAKLYKRHQNSGVQEPSAVTLATATPDAKPSARIVLLKEFDVSGFVFYCNLGSRKSAELMANPAAALCFYWETIGYQVRVEGQVQQVSAREADDYFATRPRASQVGAWASRQSEILSSRKALQARVRKFETRFAGSDVPRPEFWSGFRVTPESIEFWQRGLGRLHERTLYSRDADGWRVRLLYP